MKKTRIIPFAIILMLIVSVGCNKDKVDPVDCNAFYSLESFDIGVVPKSRKVQILFQAKGCEDVGIPDLTLSDIEVLENGFSMDSEADIQISPSEIPFEVKTVLLLDITGSVEGLVGQIKQASLSLISQKLPNQQIAIYAFDKDLKLIQGFTTNPTLLTQAVNSLPETGLINSTNLYGALIDLDLETLWTDIYSVDGIEDGSLVLFTDGRHNANQTQTLADAKSAIGDKKVFVAALESSDLVEAPLKDISKNGGYYYAADIASLEQAFLDIQARIVSLSSSIYYLYYTSPISDPTPFDNELIIQINGNTNQGVERRIVTSFNSQGFE